MKFAIFLIVAPIALLADEVTGGCFEDLPLGERKELVWMAKAANAAYPGVPKPIGYRSFSRMEWDACAEGCDELKYTEDGYFNVGSSGLRGRLMYSSGRVVLAFSGCDFVDDKDIKQCIQHYFLIGAPQYKQSLRLMNNVLSSKPFNDLWIVGHSLGGSIVTYLALNLPEGCTRIKCATFNGYGASPLLRCEKEREVLASSRIRNVYCEGDPIYNNEFSPSARHFGPSYSLKCEGDWLLQHSIDNMLKLMIEKRSVWSDLQTKNKAVLK